MRSFLIATTLLLFCLPSPSWAEDVNHDSRLARAALRKPILMSDGAQPRSHAPAAACNSARSHSALWSDPPYRYTAMAHSLFCGGTEPVDSLLRQNDIPTHELQIAESIANYLRGVTTSDDHKLISLDHRNLPSSIAGAIALLKAMIYQDPTAQSAALAEDAILLAPGTPVEEAARHFLLDYYARVGDLNAFSKSLQRYASRHPHARTSDEEWTDAISILAANSDLGNPEDKADIERVAYFLSNEARPAFLMALSELALRAGRLSTAAHAARLLGFQPSMDRALRAIARADTLLAMPDHDSVTDHSPQIIPGKTTDIELLFAAIRNYITSTTSHRGGPQMTEDPIGPKSGLPPSDAFAASFADERYGNRARAILRVDIQAREVADSLMSVVSTQMGR